MNSSNRASIEQRIEELRAEYGPEFGPDVVVRDAEKPESPLHTEFEWDDEKAADARRRDVARRLIRSVTALHTTEVARIAVPRYVRNPDAKPNEQSYVAAADLRTDHDRAWAALSYAIDQADAAIRRAAKVALAVGLEQEVEFVATAIAKIKSEIRQPA